MGSATLARSKTRSTNKADLRDRDLSSPLAERNGSNILTRRHIAQMSVEKVNSGLPSSINEASQSQKGVKVSRKRKVTPAVSSNSAEDRDHTAILASSSQTLANKQASPSRRCDFCNTQHEEAEHGTRVENHGNMILNNVQIFEARASGIVPNGMKAASCMETVDPNENLGKASCTLLTLLEKNYDGLYKKYQKLKVRRLEEVDSLFEQQNARVSARMKATQALIDHFQKENDYLRQQILNTDIDDFRERCKSLERELLKYRNDLVLENSKNLELTTEIKQLKCAVPSLPFGSPLKCNLQHAENGADTMLSYRLKSMQQILEHMLGLKITFSGDGQESAHIHFEHEPTGFSFNLRADKDPDIAELVFGGELVYENVSLGICKPSAEWMKEQGAIFGISQMQLLFKRLMRFLQQGA